MGEPIWSKQIQHWIDIKAAGETTAKFANATELLTWNPTQDKEEYAPKYIERGTSPKYKTGGSFSIEMETDAMKDSELHTWLMSHEHDDNVSADIVRVKTFSGETTAMDAELATFSMNMAPIKLSANEPAKLNPTFDMTSDGWTAGTWNNTTKAFTVKAAG